MNGTFFLMMVAGAVGILIGALLLIWLIESGRMDRMLDWLDSKLRRD